MGGTILLLLRHYVASVTRRGPGMLASTARRGGLDAGRSTAAPGTQLEGATAEPTPARSAGRRTGVDAGRSTSTGA